MSISTPFIKRPVATTLFLVALTLAGAMAYTLLPVSSLPEVDFPTINVQASLPGARPGGDGGLSCNPTGKAIHAHCRRYRNDLPKLGWIGPGDAAIRSKPRYQRRGARCAGGD